MAASADVKYTSPASFHGYTSVYNLGMEQMQPHQLNRMFRENFRSRRIELGLSQQAVADRITALRGKEHPRVHAPYISDLESGRKSPVLGTLAELAEALETTPAFLIALQPSLITTAAAH